MRRSLWFGVLAIVALVGTLLIGVPASAVAPDNDSFATPAALSSTTSGSVAVTTVEATSDGFPVNHTWASTDDHGGRSVWFTWTAPGAVGPTSFVVEDATDGTVFSIGLYTYDGTALTELAYNMYSPVDEVWSRAQVDVTPTAGTTYVIGVGSNVGVPATLSWAPYTEPGNDDFAAALPLPASATGSTIHATFETGEPIESALGDVGGRSVWYYVAPTEESTVRVDLADSTYDTFLAAFTGTLADLAFIAEDDDGSTGGYHDSYIEFVATAGTTYYIAVGGYGGYWPESGQALEWGDSGTFVLTSTVLTGTIPAAVATPTVADTDDGSVTLSWTAPDDGGSAILGYEIRYDSNWYSTPIDAGLVTSYAVTGLSNGQLYNFQVRAYNAHGPGPWSSTVSATPSTLPSAPSGVVLTGQGDGYVSVQWNGAASNGSPVTSYTLAYRVQSSADEWTTIAVQYSDRTKTVSGLTNGTTYELKLLATNANGDGPYSSVVTGMPRSTAVGFSSVTVVKGTANVTVVGQGLPEPTIFECRLNNMTTWETCTPGVPWTHKVKGAREVQVRAKVAASDTMWVSAVRSLRIK